MKSSIKKRRLRLAMFTVAAALLSAGLTVPALSASAADTSTKYLGTFEETGPGQIAANTVSRYGVRPASVMWFDSWGSGEAFRAAEAKALWGQGIMPHYTWEPWDLTLSVSDPQQIHLQDIIDGEWDSYLKARGAQFAAAGVPIMVRWGHEFNGDWYPWGVANNGGNPALYVSAYRRVHDLVVAAGATNVQWVWAFNNAPAPAVSYNDAARAYPGDAYVDWVGIDGYNWGMGPSWDPSGNHWTSFNSMLANSYAQARSIAPKRPVMLAEVGSSEDGGSKAQWINDMSTALNSGSYPDLKMVTYFDQDKEELWSGISTTAAKTAFTNWVNQSYMKGTGTDLAQVAARYKGTTTPATTSPTPTVSPTISASPTGGSPSPTTSGTPSSSPSTATCSATYRTISSWPGGYQGEVTVLGGNSAISGWTVHWSTAGQTISQVWNGALVGSDPAPAVTNTNWNGSLTANAATTFGFIATGSSTTPTLTCASA